MFPYFLCLFVQLVFITAVSGASIFDCVRISPQTEVVELYTNFTAYCVLNHTCLLQHDITVSTEELYWDINGQKIPESQYKIFNETTASVTFLPTMVSYSTLSCSFDANGHVKTNLHGLIFRTGYPPEKPSNLSCICYNNEKMNCTWNSGRGTLITTTYTVKQLWRQQERPSCESKTNSCSFKEFSLYIDATFWVVASNDLGTVQSDPITMDVINVLKPNPPEIMRVVSAVELERALKIEWKNPMTDHFKMKYNIRYRRQDQPTWNEVPAEDINSHRTSYTLQDLEPYTTYVLTLRCKLDRDQGYWSDWSREYTSTTPESAPSQSPEFWRRIGDVDSDGNRMVWFMWKDSHGNGKILGYNITIRNGAQLVDALNVKDRKFNVTLPRDKHRIALLAYNGVGPSPPSTLVIPDVRYRGSLLPEIRVEAFPKEGKLWVEWTAPQKEIYGFVIEWCENEDSHSCSTDWQRERNTSRGAFLKGDIKPYVYYWIKVHPLYMDGIDRPQYVAAYLKQGVPDEGPTVKYKTLEKTRAILMWEPVPLEKQNGFITNYTLRYSDKNGHFGTVVLNATQREYTLTSLTGGTLYEVRVAANTEMGGAEGHPFTFSTNKFGVGEVEAIVVSSCLGFFICLLVGVILFCNKRELIKKHLWPNVPDPSKSNIAQWSPHTPTRHDPKKHPFKDDSLTNVSVVEITTDEKKTYSEQDLKSEDTIKKNTSECLSSGIGGSSGLSSPRLSMSDTDEVESAQNTSSTVQYSTVIISGYRGQQPTAAIQPTFSRSESTQPLLESEERPDEQPVLEMPNQYFKQNCTQDNSAGRLSVSHQENLSNHLQEQQSHKHLAAYRPEMDLQDIGAGPNAHFGGDPAPPDLDSGCSEIKSYLPQTVRRGGYMPQ